MSTPPHVMALRIGASAIVVLIATIMYMSMPASADFKQDDPIVLYEGWEYELKEYTYSLCEENNVSYDMVLAIIYNESRFNADAIHVNKNGTTDWGLMQINDVCFDFLHTNCGINSMKELLDPELNIMCGIAILSHHKEFTEDDSLALLRYQVGAGTYKKMIKNGITTNQTHTAVMDFAMEYSNAKV